MTTNQPEFIAIGDMVIDAFIRLGDKSKARIIKNENGTKEIALPFGDKIEFDFAEEIAAVGNSANAAVSAARLGLSSGLVVNIGGDNDGKKCLVQMEKDGVTAEFVKVHADKKTNYHYVLWYQDERTILIKHEEYEYELPNIGKPKCIYLSSLSENALPFHTNIANYLEAHPEIKFIFQPGTFQMKWGTDSLKRIYQRTDVFFCNTEEAERILKLEAKPKTPERLKELLDGLRALGPKLPVITDGPGGAYTYSSIKSAGPTAGGEIAHLNYDQVIHLDIYPDIAPPYERTGAGDAFASTFSVAYTLGHDVSTCLKWGSINSMNVCQHVGAQAGLLSHEKIEEYLKNSPAGWDVKVVVG